LIATRTNDAWDMIARMYAWNAAAMRATALHAAVRGSNGEGKAMIEAALTQRFPLGMFRSPFSLAALICASACTSQSPGSTASPSSAGAGTASPTGAASAGTASLMAGTLATAGHVAANSAGTNAASAGASATGEPTPPRAGHGAAGSSLAGAGMGGGADGGAAGSGTTPPPSAGSGGSPAENETPATCPTTVKLKPGDTKGSIQSGTHLRTYLVHVPAKYTGTAPVPLVFDFHGYSSNSQQQMGLSGFRELGEQEGFIVVYPDGIGSSWSVNGCCGQAGMEMLDESAFVHAMLEQVKKDVCVDAKRVYATGISQGGGMAHHMACLAADVIAAVAPVSSDLRTDPCVPARPITEISFRGEADTLDAYGGGHVGPPGMAGYTAIGAKPTLERWRMIDMCTGPSTMMDSVCETYTTCAAGVEVSLCSIPGADHVLYTNPKNVNVPKIAWEMFKKHPLGR
jgi:polyhydroxybutyrate depolymerase